LQCPARTGNENNIMVYCQVGLTEAGKARWSFCFTPEYEQFPYRNELERATAEARFVPASVDGENVEVSFPFRVSLSWDGDRCTLAAIPNWAFDPAMGNNYIAPQEVLQGGHGWVRRARSMDDFVALEVNRGDIEFSMSLLASLDGTASDSRLEHNALATRRELRNALRALEGSRFIPGFYGGEPVPMRYYEILFYD
jgi:hypothetical protein